MSIMRVPTHPLMICLLVTPNFSRRYWIINSTKRFMQFPIRILHVWLFIRISITLPTGKVMRDKTEKYNRKLFILKNDWIIISYDIKLWIWLAGDKYLNLVARNMLRIITMTCIRQWRLCLVKATDLQSIELFLVGCHTADVRLGIKERAKVIRIEGK